MEYYIEMDVLYLLSAAFICNRMHTIYLVPLTEHVSGFFLALVGRLENQCGEQSEKYRRGNTTGSRSKAAGECT